MALTKIVPQDVAEMLSGEGPDQNHYGDCVMYIKESTMIPQPYRSQLMACKRIKNEDERMEEIDRITSVLKKKFKDMYYTLLEAQQRIDRYDEEIKQRNELSLLMKQEQALENA